MMAEVERTRTIVVVPYDPSWIDRFREEEARLRALFGDAFVRAHHIGSTSIPGLVAKPIVDLLVEVRSVEALDEIEDSIDHAGYRVFGEFGIAGRRFYVKGFDPNRTHHVHAYGVHHPRLRDHLLFRDFLREHPDEATSYGRLKRELAARFPHDMNGYMDGKDEFITGIIRRAEAWRPGEPAGEEGR